MWAHALEVVLSLFALLSVRLIAINHRYGGYVGVACQTCWVSYWIYSKQFGFLIIDCGLIFIYLDYIRQCYKDKKI